MFLLRRAARGLAGLGDGLRVGRAARRPGDEGEARRIVEAEQLRIMQAARRIAGLRQEDDLRFETFGRVDGHHAHRLARRFHVPFDRNIGRRELGEKAGERGRPFAIMGQRKAQEFIDRIGRLRPEPGDEIAPAAAGTDQSHIEEEGCQRRSPRAARSRASPPRGGDARRPMRRARPRDLPGDAARAR